MCLMGFVWNKAAPRTLGLSSFSRSTTVQRPCYIGANPGSMAWYSSHGLELFPLQNGWLNDAKSAKNIGFQACNNKLSLLALQSFFLYDVDTYLWAFWAMGPWVSLIGYPWHYGPLASLDPHGQDCLDQASYLIARGDEAWSCEHYDSLCITLMI